MQPTGTADRKKKNFSFSRKFPFMKSKDQSGSEDAISADERKCYKGIDLADFLLEQLWLGSWFHADYHRIAISIAGSLY